MRGAKISYFVLGNLVYDLCVGSVPFFQSTRDHIWALLEGSWKSLPLSIKGLLEELVMGEAGDLN